MSILLNKYFFSWKQILSVLRKLYTSKTKAKIIHFRGKRFVPKFAKKCTVRIPVKL